MKIGATNISFKANKMSKIQAQYIDKELREAKNVDIICHHLTDRDAANSALAMWEYINAMGVNARIIMSQKTPLSLGLRNYDCNIVQDKQKEEIDKIIPDISFCVDFGGSERVSPQVLEHIKKSGKVMGFDHHSEVDIAQGEYIQLKKSINGGEYINSKAPFYSDMSAKSATSVIYRYFEALGEQIDNSRAYDLFSGFVDDAAKRNLVKCDGSKGLITVQSDLYKDKNAYEIYTNLKRKLTDKQIADVARNIDALSFLTPEQQKFNESLKERLQYSENGKIAYLQIPPDDKEWEKLGGDNTVTSMILNRFRQAVLKENEEVEMAIVFYEAHGSYRLSAHSKKINLLDYFKYIEDNSIANFTQTSGGHPDRAGGSINTTNSKECALWVQKIINCSDFLEKTL